MRSKVRIRSWWLTRRRSPPLRKRIRTFSRIGAATAGVGAAWAESGAMSTAYSVRRTEYLQTSVARPTERTGVEGRGPARRMRETEMFSARRPGHDVRPEPGSVHRFREDPSGLLPEVIVHVTRRFQAHGLLG